ncbi:hypothetical protein SAMN05421688_1550 [Poseidonocella pacifica]|uniref:Clp protease n=1 Tax=Poseidonocella pacifica TaxID=871651 RepID=A0A1I0WMA3_9RHOB|nr:hypothetical protein [Poseidonocella pacifica]SFA89507.1 hypothetical protein SAMN05421688_1550 [Poseidonocella pacifica]
MSGGSTGPGTIRRAITALVAVQIAIGAALMLMDLNQSFPGGDPLTAPRPTGPATRPFRPDRAPGPSEPPGGGRMADRLEIGGEGTEMTLSGQIAPGDGARVAEALASRSPAASSVQLHSTGGSVSDALEIGEALRAGGIDTVIGENSVCYSACPYVFAGGATREVASTGRLGVHQHYFGQNAYLPAFTAVEDVQRGQAEVMAYLGRMGIEIAVMEHALRTPPEQIYILSREELERYRFVPAKD